MIKSLHFEKQKYKNRLLELRSVKGEIKTVVHPKSRIVLTRKDYLVFINLLKLVSAELIVKLNGFYY